MNQSKTKQNKNASLTLVGIKAGVEGNEIWLEALDTGWGISILLGVATWAPASRELNFCCKASLSVARNQ